MQGRKLFELDPCDRRTGLAVRGCLGRPESDIRSVPPEQKRHCLLSVELIHRRLAYAVQQVARGNATTKRGGAAGRDTLDGEGTSRRGPIKQDADAT